MTSSVVSHGQIGDIERSSCLLLRTRTYGFSVCVCGPAMASQRARASWLATLWAVGSILLATTVSGDDAAEYRIRDEVFVVANTVGDSLL